MDAPELLRSARRHAGLSQRGLAAAAGVDRSTIEAAEAGRRTPSWSVLQAVLAATGLELTVDRACEPLCPHARRHLHRSLSSRLHLVLGGDDRPRWSTPPPGWADLDRLARHGPVFLTGRAAVGLWLPGLDAGRVQVRWAPPADAPEANCRGLDVRTEPLPRDCTVTVPLRVRSLRTPPPGLLALHPDCGHWRRSLRSAARALHEDAAVDPAGGGRRRTSNRAGRTMPGDCCSRGGGPRTCVRPTAWTAEGGDWTTRWASGSGSSAAPRGSDTRQ